MAVDASDCGLCAHANGTKLNALHAVRIALDKAGWPRGSNSTSAVTLACADDANEDGEGGEGEHWFVLADGDVKHHRCRVVSNWR